MKDQSPARDETEFFFNTRFLPSTSLQDCLYNHQIEYDRGYAA